nr:protein kinase, ATP binding site-containing protein [Tanacetum cinerariifolium]
MSSSVNLEDFRIPHEEIKRATGNFRFQGLNRSCKRELSERWQNRTAFIKRHNKEEYESHELDIVSRLHHENITSFIGYCDEDDNYIYTAYEYFGPTSLYDILSTSKYGVIGWADRLKICIRVAKVLNYLHSGIGECGRVIHGDVKCENILVKRDNLELIKVCGFTQSKLVPLNQPHQLHYCPKELFEKPHTDPVYKETNLLNTGLDVYSFGVLMFQILHTTGSNQIIRHIDKDLQQLINMVRGCYDDGPYKLVDPKLKGKFDHRSLHIFTAIAYKCISFEIKERPSMNEI